MGRALGLLAVSVFAYQIHREGGGERRVGRKEREKESKTRGKRERERTYKAEKTKEWDLVEKNTKKEKKKEEETRTKKNKGKITTHTNTHTHIHTYVCTYVHSPSRFRSVPFLSLSHSSHYCCNYSTGTYTHTHIHIHFFGYCFPSVFISIDNKKCGDVVCGGVPPEGIEREKERYVFKREREREIGEEEEKQTNNNKKGIAPLIRWFVCTLACARL